MRAEPEGRGLGGPLAVAEGLKHIPERISAFPTTPIPPDTSTPRPCPTASAPLPNTPNLLWPSPVCAPRAKRRFNRSTASRLWPSHLGDCLRAEPEGRGLGGPLSVAEGLKHIPERISAFPTTPIPPDKSAAPACPTSSAPLPSAPNLLWPSPAYAPRAALPAPPKPGINLPGSGRPRLPPHNHPQTLHHAPGQAYLLNSQIHLFKYRQTLPPNRNRSLKFFSCSTRFDQVSLFIIQK